MMHPVTQQLVVDACVDVQTETTQGRGCLIPGNLILTAAHCTEYDFSGQMALEDYIHTITTTTGAYRVHPLVVEPVADIAVLGALDNEQFPEDARAFEAWCERTTPLTLWTAEWPLWTPIGIAIYTHKRTWQYATAEQAQPHAPHLTLHRPTPFRRGTSGSPILAYSGTIVGVVSQDPTAPRPHLTLPVWVMQHVRRAMKTLKEM
jgi:hypothetical protein